MSDAYLLKAAVHVLDDLLDRVEAWNGGDACFACDSRTDERWVCTNLRCVTRRYRELAARAQGAADRLA